MPKPVTDINKAYTYNLSELLQLSNGSNDFTANMLEIFIRSATEMLSQISNGLLESDWKKVYEVSHKAIPSFHFMGLVSFSEKLKYIETNAFNEEEHQHIKEVFGFIDKNMVVILQDLKAELEKFRA